MRPVLSVPVLAATLALSAPSLAANLSATTDLDLDRCSILQSDDFGTSWACPGYRGLPFYVAEGDLRFFVSFGFGAPDEIAASQTLPPFNTLDDEVEWRLQMVAGRPTPIAAILRYNTSDVVTGEIGGEILVVVKIAEGATCQIAWVDAKANADAEALAREAADKRAAEFECSSDPQVVGKFEAWEL